ncbi:hypothetical protein Ga0100231_020245 [Opitutaceae bacterium TAV4]|nr:hypothetical protein Ga0100231_020245 [Opitutaceae bacterium TAV4]RRK00385.1 hypothetical protein Ga0100230_021035 [Opitutaceae bacterium TAV3]
MPNTNYIPRTDAAFNDWIRFLYSYVAGNAARLGVKPADLTALSPLVNNWGDKYETALNPASRTPAATADKNAARKALETAVRDFVKANLSTGNKAVTDADRENMGLTIPKTTHTPHPVATRAPGCRVDTSLISHLIIHFFDPDNLHHAKLFGQQGTEIAWGISTTPVTAAEDLPHSSFDTRSPFTLEFSAHDRGKTVYFCLRWENTTGKKGPWSDIFSAIIP